MKTKFLILAIAISAIFGLAVAYASNDAVDYNVCENIEALAGGEGSEFESPTGYPYVTVCNVAIGGSGWGTQRCKVQVITCQGGGHGCNPRPCPVHG